MLIVNYDPVRGKGIADNRVSDYAISMYSRANIESLRNKNLSIHVGSKIAVFAILDKIIDKTFTEKLIQFRFKGMIISTINGIMVDPPSALRREKEDKAKVMKRVKYSITTGSGGDW